MSVSGVPLLWERTWFASMPWHATWIDATAKAVIAMVLVWLTTILLDPFLIPGKPHAMLFLFADAPYPQPRASILSWTSHLWARWDWWCHALRRRTTAVGLARCIVWDHAIDWTGGQRPNQGDLIYAWDRVFEWNADCIDMAALEAMRDLGDPLSEQAMAALSMGASSQQSVHRGDVMERIANHVLSVKAREGDSKDVIAHFWQAVNRRPPPGAGALNLTWYLDKGLLSQAQVDQMGHGEVNVKRVQQTHWLPSDADKDNGPWTLQQQQTILEEEDRVLQRARQTFHRYGATMLVGLLLVGLGGGFASPRITDVLRSTGYLVPASQKHKQDAIEHEQVLLHRLQTFVDQGLVGQKTREREDGMPTAGPSVATPTLDVPSQSSSDRTYRRLLETMTFVLDLMEEPKSLHPPAEANGPAPDHDDAKAILQRGGRGWLACCRVRFLHTAVRRRLHGSRGDGQAGYLNTDAGVAINQEDLLATLCAFSVAPLWSLQRIGLPPTQQEREDLLAFWRHVGFYMGVEPHLLRRHFRDIRAAERTFCCISSHHFLPLAGRTDCHSTPPPSIPTSFGPSLLQRSRTTPTSSAPLDDLSRLAAHFDFDQGPALPLLWSVADRPPGGMAFATLCAIARFLLGPGLANATGLPRTTAWQRLTMRLRLLVLVYPVLFGRYYLRRNWETQFRTQWTVLIRRVVVWVSQGKRASFATSQDGSHDDTYSPYPLDPTEGATVVRRYRRLIREMIVVTLLVPLTAVMTLLLWRW